MAESKKRHVKKISLFNHKGGVGKTFLTVNIAARIASRGKRVALIDTDPQCNLTSFLIANEVVDKWLDKSDSAAGETIWSALKPVVEAEGKPRKIALYGTPVDNLFLLPGDIKLAEFESELGDFWSQCFQRKAKGFRGVSAISQFTNELSERYKIDYLFYDSGPSIGPLNKTLILDSDFFITPVACDLFSLRGIKTLGRSLVSWIEDWRTIEDIAPIGAPLISGNPRYLGYVAQRVRTYRKKAAADYSHYLSLIEKEIRSEIVELLRIDNVELAPSYLNVPSLGEVRDFGRLAIESQDVGLPVWQLPSISTDQMREHARVFDEIVDKIIRRTSRE